MTEIITANHTIQLDRETINKTFGEECTRLAVINQDTLDQISRMLTEAQLNTLAHAQVIPIKLHR